MYITRFETSAFRPLATFEEDIDVTRGTESGVTMAGDSLATWKEATLMLRSSNRNNTSASQDNQAVTVGWNNRVEDADTADHGPAARYTVSLPSNLAGDWELDSGTTLDFMLGPTNNVPGLRPSPDASDDDEEADEGMSAASDDLDASAGDAEEAEDPTVDLSIEVADASGQTARIILSDYAAIRRPLETYVMRRSDLEARRFQDHWELVLQTYSIPLSDFLSDNRSLDPGSLTSISFVFDQVHAGEVVIDQIGFTDIDPAFIESRVDGGS
jgi:hypothetical protein